MDVVMPEMSGLVATAEIMSQVPCAVVVMSNLLDTGSQQVAFEALRAGAVEVMGKPRDIRNPRVRHDLRKLLKAMATVKVVRRRGSANPKEIAQRRELQVLAIGSSTGGPPALRGDPPAPTREFSGERVRGSTPGLRIHARAPQVAGGQHRAGGGDR